MNIRTGEWNHNRALAIAAAVAAISLVVSFRVEAQGRSASEPRFEVASVRLYSASSTSVISRPSSDWAVADGTSWGQPGGMIALRGIVLSSVLRHAFGIRPGQLKGPSWLDQDFYEILANVPADATKEQIPLMFQNLFKERFRLQFHLEPQTRRVFALTLLRDGQRLEEADEDAAPTRFAGKAPNVGSGPFGGFAMTRANGIVYAELRSATMPQLALALSQGQLLDLPVYDATGLEGSYHVTLEIDSRGLTLDAPNPLGPAILEALRKQGLNLENRRMEVENFVIDHIERSPAEN